MEGREVENSSDGHAEEVRSPNGPCAELKGEAVDRRIVRDACVPQTVI